LTDARNLPLADKVVWITGASSGIGEALAIEGAARGGRVVLSARNAGALEQVRASCANPERHLVVPMDVTRLDVMPGLAAQVLAALGKVDLLILNAGVSQRSKALDTSLAVDETILRTNFLGPVALAKAVLPSMVERKSGTVVVVSSLVGKFGTQLRTSYAASKHALHGFFEGLRAETWQDGIQVSIVCPGYIRTEISKNALTRDGQPHGIMDAGQAAGMPSDVFARRMLDAVAAGREEVYIGGREMMAVHLKRFAPGLFSRFIRRAKVT
jgi:short-subunit dehydrogenase